MEDFKLKSKSRISINQFLMPLTACGRDSCGGRSALPGEEENGNLVFICIPSSQIVAFGGIGDSLKIR